MVKQTEPVAKIEAIDGYFVRRTDNGYVFDGRGNWSGTITLAHIFHLHQVAKQSLLELLKRDPTTKAEICCFETISYRVCSELDENNRQFEKELAELKKKFNIDQPQPVQCEPMQPSKDGR